MFGRMTRQENGQTLLKSNGHGEVATLLCFLMKENVIFFGKMNMFALPRLMWRRAKR